MTHARHKLSLPAILLMLLPSFAAAAEGAAPEFSAEQITFFEKHVRPVLADNCYQCHGPDKQKSHLRLDSRAAILHGGERGAAITPGKTAESRLVAVVSYTDPELQMPPKNKLSAKDIAALTKWVEMGAPWPPGEETTVPLTPIKRGGPTITEEDRQWWAYQPLRPRTAEPPKPRRSDWATNEIDAFILTRLEQQGLEPNGPANRYQLVRRAYYDLIGLPPTPREVEAFVNDARPDAWERLIEDLLARPQYGEKWGRHWLDLVRYADTNGYERDNPKPSAWRYRDYVINAFNNDKPYDRFVLEQIAGDELPDADNESIIATGYQRLGIWDDEPADPDQAFYDSLDDVVSTTGSAFMAMSIGCARCHDHKKDPLPQRDYYRLLAFFGNTFNNITQRQYEKTAFTLNTTVPLASDAEERRQAEQQAKYQSELDALTAKVASFEERIVATFSPPEREDAADEHTREVLIRKKAASALSAVDLEQYESLRRAMKKLQREKLPSLPEALCIRENGRDAVATHVLLRGSAHAKGDAVEPGFPQVLGFDDPAITLPPPGINSSGRRLALAKWLIDPVNPLTARVMVNRIWQHHFGRGIVPTPSEFGKLGDLPTHPVLLDYLAAKFIDGGWKIKDMHRLIMKSSAYRMSSDDNSRALEVDPANLLFWRYDMRRLTAEEIRDSILAANGTLNLKMGGPGIYTQLPAAVLATASRPDSAWGNSPPEEEARRSIYVYLKRSLIEPMLFTFDLPDTDSPTAARFTTTVPTQALTMLNSGFMGEQAQRFADRLRNDAGDDLRQQIARGWWLVTQRPPAPAEIDRSVAFLDELQSTHGMDREQAMHHLCLMMLNLNEFVYLD